MMKTTIKTLLFTALACFTCYPAAAQFLGGFFSQQSRQRKLMGEQIAQYGIYLRMLQTGYHISESGLNIAQELKNGTLGLQGDYIGSLTQVSPLIRSNPKGRAIADLGRQTLTLLADEISWQQHQKILTATETGYLQKVRDNLADQCQLNMDELLQVLTPGKLQLSDGQRLQRLDRLYEEMKDKYAFARSFTARCRRLTLARINNRQNKAELKKLYGIQ
ncbi:hypothetical protein [Mucilaginibacter aquaedulcis]|uniref:hypothetical protein n=1 Tax=Mucilaginibacter aquaedulcis TaxID=1187081 RepID=UPI0025B4271F|nr:hypothetical protein [Mucilaginibacter aquaedulcis]MDN3548972.1 hypothetical protein [Mucilaginibacter aquaedulcis]